MVLSRIELQSLFTRQYLGKQPFVYRNLFHLKRNISAVPDNLRSGFDKFHEEAAKRPVFYYPWKNQAPKKISQIVCQDE